MKKRLSAMPIQVRTEFMKLATTRGPWVLTLLAMVLTALLGLQPVFKAGRGSAPSIGTVGAELGVLDAMGRGALIALVIGVLIMTTEFRHQTVSASLLQSPRRTELISAKAVTAILVGLLQGFAALIIVLAIGAASGAIRIELINGDIILHAVGLYLTYPLYALIGVGIGALLAANQPLAVVLPVLWLGWLETFTLSSLGQGLSVWSIGGTAMALQNAGNLPGVLPVWLGASLLLAYATVIMIIGAIRLFYADIS
jgi:ABC-2 type transport system permease protein